MRQYPGDPDPKTCCQKCGAFPTAFHLMLIRTISTGEEREAIACRRCGWQPPPGFINEAHINAVPISEAKGVLS